jgi:DnaJ like chaperone protein
MLGLVLSAILAEYYSQSLRAQYQSWSVWRSVFGSDPNQVTSILGKVSWSIFFVLSWWMLWKLDFFWAKAPSPLKDADEKPSVEEEKKESTEETNGTGKKGDYETRGKKESKENVEQETGASFASVKREHSVVHEELQFAKTLGVEEPFEAENVKSAYRKLIAQYHPDRVSAMGPEIREIAELKAKEINEAYEYFRKKFGPDE